MKNKENSFNEAIELVSENLKSRDLHNKFSPETSDGLFETYYLELDRLKQEAEKANPNQKIDVVEIYNNLDKRTLENEYFQGVISEALNEGEYQASTINVKDQFLKLASEHLGDSHSEERKTELLNKYEGFAEKRAGELTNISTFSLSDNTLSIPIDNFENEIVEIPAEIKNKTDAVKHVAYDETIQSFFYGVTKEEKTTAAKMKNLFKQTLAKKQVEQKQGKPEAKKSAFSMKL